MEYISEQLTDSIKKIRICDESIDKDKEKDRLLSYYQKKYSKLSFDQFKYDFIDLFCGAGGLSVGLEQVGFKPIIAVDKDLSALKTYRFNRPWMDENSLIHDDIFQTIEMKHQMADLWEKGEVQVRRICTSICTF